MKQGFAWMRPSACRHLPCDQGRTCFHNFLNLIDLSYFAESTAHMQAGTSHIQQSLPAIAVRQAQSAIPKSTIRNPTFHIQLPTSYIQHPTSYIPTIFPPEDSFRAGIFYRWWPGAARYLRLRKYRANAWGTPSSGRFYCTGSAR